MEMVGVSDSDSVIEGFGGASDHRKKTTGFGYAYGLTFVL